MADKILFLKKDDLRELRFEAAKKTCRIRAKNDLEALERWLDEYFDKATTFRSYKKEGERFLVWCLHVRKTQLSILNREDVEAYIEFMKKPEPKEIWCGPRRKRSQDLENRWFPFAGPLGPSALKTALASLNSLMGYLVDAGYADFNPFILIKRKNRFKKTLEEQVHRVHERILEPEEWSALLQCIEEEPTSSDKELFQKNRLRWLVMALYFLGLRIDELAKAAWSDCRKQNDKWWFYVVGKGERLGKIPINSQLLESMMQWRHFMGKSPLPTESDESPLLASWPDKNRALSCRQLHNLLKALALKAAKKFDPGSKSAQKLAKFSPHWLRHLSASRQDLAGISFTHIKSNLRHQNEQTTRIYVHAFDDDRHKDMEKLKL